VVAEAVVAGGGIALMPRWTMRAHPALVLRPIDGGPGQAAHRRPVPPRTHARTAVRTVLAELRRAAGTIKDRDAGEPAPATA
jgi:DNA-binding transcriptional LysR family regulator